MNGIPMKNTTMKGYFAAKRFCKSQRDQNYNVKESNKFLIHLSGMLGKLPKSEDIERTVGKCYDFLSSF